MPHPGDAGAGDVSPDVKAGAGPASLHRPAASEPACPRCGALPGARCRTKAGKPFQGHYDDQHRARRWAVTEFYEAVVDEQQTEHGTIRLTRAGITFRSSCYEHDDFEDSGHDHRLRFEGPQDMVTFANQLLAFAKKYGAGANPPCHECGRPQETV